MSLCGLECERVKEICLSPPEGGVYPQQHLPTVRRKFRSLSQTGDRCIKKRTRLNQVNLVLQELLTSKLHRCAKQNICIRVYTSVNMRGSLSISVNECILIYTPNQKKKTIYASNSNIFCGLQLIFYDNFLIALTLRE